MKALNPVGLTPISVLSEKRKPSLRFHSPVNSTTNPKNFSETFPRSFHHGLVFFSSVLSAGSARALTYEEALQQSVGSSPSVGSSSFDLGEVLDRISGFAAENPLVVAGGAAIVAVPLILSQVFGGKPKPWGVESARSAYGRLADDGDAQLLDIRAAGEARKVGGPDIKELKKKPVSVVYRGEDKPGFLKKLSLKFKEPEKTTLIILDKFDGNSELVAELVTANGFKAAYAVKDGAEGPRGWMNSGLPWILPSKTPSLDISGLTDAIGDVVGEGSDALPVTLGLAAAAGLGLLAFSEVETILQILGSAAIVQVVSKKLLFAEDRKQTLLELDEFLNTKVAPKELLGEIKDIGKAFLPAPVTGKALPAPAQASPVAADDTAEKPDATSEPSMTVADNNAQNPEAEAAPKPAPQINSVARAEVEAQSLNGTTRPLSPYPNYPDFKPPTSPTPAQP